MGRPSGVSREGASVLSGAPSHPCCYRARPYPILVNSSAPVDTGIHMDLATLTLFLPACFALNMAPGPNNLLSVSNSTRYGYRTSCLAGVGRLLAFAGMIALASAGLAVVLQTSELLFYGIKILGAAYLFYLAYQLWRANPQAEAESTAAKAGLWALARQEFLVAAGNPNDCQYKTS